MTLSPKAYAAIVLVLSAFLIITGSLYVGLLFWMSVNNLDATGTALQKLELFCVGNLGLLLGAIFKPMPNKSE